MFNESGVAEMEVAARARIGYPQPGDYGVHGDRPSPPPRHTLTPPLLPALRRRPTDPVPDPSHTWSNRPLSGPTTMRPRLKPRHS